MHVVEVGVLVRFNPEVLFLMKFIDSLGWYIFVRIFAFKLLEINVF